MTKASVRWLRGAAVAAVVAALPGLALAQSPPRTLGYPAAGVALGQGWNSLGVQPTGSTCLVFAPQRSTTAQTVVSQRAMVSDKASFSQALNAAADGRVRTMAGFSADAKSTYVSNTQLNSSSLNVVELITVDNGWTYAAGAPVSAAAPKNLTGAQLAAAPPAVKAQQVAAHQAVASLFQPASGTSVQARNAAFASSLQRLYTAGSARLGATQGTSSSSLRLTDDMASLAKTNLQQFLQQCGDSFVSAIQEGGEMAVTYSFLTASQSDQQNIAASLNVSYSEPFFSASGGASVASALASSNSSASVNISYFQTGGSGLPVPTSLQAIDGAGRGFPAAVAANPQPFQIQVSDYSSLPNYPAGGPGRASPNAFARLAQVYGKAETLLADATRIDNDLRDPVRRKGYVTARWGGSLAAVDAVQQQASDTKQTLQAWARGCVNAATAKVGVTCDDAIGGVDDLTSRLVFPLTTASAAETLQGLWYSPQAYQAAVIARWVAPLNAIRCNTTLGDDCLEGGALSALQARVAAPYPTAVKLAIREQANGCAASIPATGAMGGWGTMPCTAPIDGVVLVNGQMVIVPLGQSPAAYGSFLANGVTPDSWVCAFGGESSTADDYPNHKVRRPVTLKDYCNRPGLGPNFGGFWQVYTDVGGKNQTDGTSVYLKVVGAQNAAPGATGYCLGLPMSTRYGFFRLSICDTDLKLLTFYPILSN